MPVTIRVIRAGKRYAVSRTVQVAAPGSCASEGLLIEASAEGLRISGLGPIRFEPDAQVVVSLEGAPDMAGMVRWQNGPTVGIRLEPALHLDELDQLIHTCRAPYAGAEDTRAYGT
jgi:hypothetical protein